jgi:hypothetical protein
MRLCSLFVDSYGSQGLRWRYSKPPPYGWFKLKVLSHDCPVSDTIYWFRHTICCIAKQSCPCTSLSTVPWRCMGKWRYSSIIHHFGIRWRWVGSFISRLVYPRVGLNAEGKRKSWHSGNWTQAVQPTGCCCSDWGIRTPWWIARILW